MLYERTIRLTFENSELLWNSYHHLPSELMYLLPATKAPWDGNPFDFVRMRSNGLHPISSSGKSIEFEHTAGQSPGLDRPHSNTSSYVRYELTDLTKFKAVVMVPYSVTNSKGVEQYAMNMPMFVPSPALACHLLTIERLFRNLGVADIALAAPR